MELSNPELVDSYLRFCAYREKSLSEKHINLKDYEWFYPTTLLPLADFIKEHKDLKYTKPSNQTTERYIETIMDGPNPAAKFLTYCPMVSLPTNKEKAENALEPLYSVQQNGHYCGGENAFKYMIGELFDNIYQHSEFHHGFVMAQRYQKKRFTEICVFDDGITIPGSFEKSSKPTIRPDVDAIAQALQGATTKNEERGFGLGTCMLIATEALKGEFLVVSGSGLVYLSHGKKPSLLDASSSSKLRLRGTLISIRIPINEQNVDITKYVEKKPSL